MGKTETRGFSPAYLTCFNGHTAVNCHQQTLDFKTIRIKKNYKDLHDKYRTAFKPVCFIFLVLIRGLFLMLTLKGASNSS